MESSVSSPTTELAAALARRTAVLGASARPAEAWAHSILFAAGLRPALAAAMASVGAVAATPPPQQQQQLLPPSHQALPRPRRAREARASAQEETAVLPRPSNEPSSLLRFFPHAR